MTRVAASGPAALLGALCILGIALAPSDGRTQDSGGIVTEKLEPLAPPVGRENATGEGVVRREDRFKTVPFRGVTNPVAPALIEPVETRSAPGARLRQLDKMTGRIQTVEIASGAEGMVDRLRIRVETCRAPEDNSTHGTMAFLQIWDTKHGAAEPVFSGWMLAESPALSALDHPRYDVWVISCTTSSGETASGSE